MIVVTGATGNTGSEVVKHLLAKSQKVRAIGRGEERLQPFAANGVDPFVADITDFASLTKAFRDATAVYLMIPPNVQAEDVRAYQNSVNNALVTAVQQAGVKHAVVLSVLGSRIVTFPAAPSAAAPAPIRMKSRRESESLPMG